jgi:hypothetical protein
MLGENMTAEEVWELVERLRGTEKQHFVQSTEELYELAGEPTFSVLPVDTSDMELTHGGWEDVNKMWAQGVFGYTNCMKNPEVVSRVQAARKETMSKDPERYADIWRANLEVAQRNQKGRKRPEHAEIMRERSTFVLMKDDSQLYETWREGCWERSGGHIYRITSPTGVVTETKRVKEWCRERKMPFVTLYASAKCDGKTITKGKLKGWSMTRT